MLRSNAGKLGLWQYAGIIFRKIFHESLLRVRVIREKIRYMLPVEPERKRNVATMPQRALMQCYSSFTSL